MSTSKYRLFKHFESAKLFLDANGRSVLTGFIVFLKQEQLNFFCLIQSKQFIFKFKMLVLRKRDSGIAHIAPSDRSLLKRRDKVGRAGRGRRFCGSRSRERTQGPEVQDSLLKDDAISNSYPSIELEVAFLLVS